MSEVSYFRVKNSLLLANFISNAIGVAVIILSLIQHGNCLHFNHVLRQG